MIHKERLLMLIEALESGNYQQAKNKLRQDDKYCCLGVACDLMDDSKWVEQDYWIYCGKQGTLPDEVMLFYGFEEENPTLSKPLLSKYPASSKEYADLAAANDGNYTFKEIAQVLREQFLQEADA